MLSGRDVWVIQEYLQSSIAKIYTSKNKAVDYIKKIYPNAFLKFVCKNAFYVYEEKKKRYDADEVLYTLERIRVE